MDVRLRAELFIRDEITDPALWTTRNFAKYVAEDGHARSPSDWSTFNANAQNITNGAVGEDVGYWHVASFRGGATIRSLSE
jgi:hypothetical protein